MDLKLVREIIWPILEPYDNDQNCIKKVCLNDIDINDENIDIAYNLAEEAFRNEEKRNNNVESKSTIFIGTLGVITAIITSLLNEANNNFIGLKSILLLISIIYFVRAIWFSVKALERKTFCTLGFADINIKGDNITYKKQLIIKLINMLRCNSEVINIRVDYMSMAQDYFKRGVVTLLLLAPLKVISIINRNMEIKSTIGYIIEILNSIQISSWIIFVLFFMCLFNLAYIIYLQKNNRN